MHSSTVEGGPDEGRFDHAWAENRRYLLNVAYRLVGSFSEAEDLVQESYARLLRTDSAAIDDVRGWLVVVVTRLCLDHLRSARMRRETLPGPWFPEPLVKPDGAELDPAEIVTLDESVRMALLIVLERLSPAERVAFVLHDVFQFSFEEIAPMVERTPAACRQLASRARRRISAESLTEPAAVDPHELRRVAERFITACAGGDLQSLLEVLDPAIVGWVDLGEQRNPFPQPAMGRDVVAPRAMALFGRDSGARLLLAQVNGETGILVAVRGRPFAVLVLVIRMARIAAIYAIADPAKLRHVRVAGKRG